MVNQGIVRRTGFSRSLEESHCGQPEDSEKRKEFATRSRQRLTLEERQRVQSVIEGDLNRAVRERAAREVETRDEAPNEVLAGSVEKEMTKSVTVPSILHCLFSL